MSDKLWLKSSGKWNQVNCNNNTLVNSGRSIGDICYTISDIPPDGCLMLDGSVVKCKDYPDLSNMCSSWIINNSSSETDFVPHYEPSDRNNVVQGFKYSGSGTSYKEEFTINNMSVVTTGYPWNNPNTALESFNIFNTSIGSNGYSYTLYQAQPGYDNSITMTFPIEYNPIGLGIRMGTANNSETGFPTTFKFYGITNTSELDLLIDMNTPETTTKFKNYPINADRFYNSYRLIAKSSNTALVISQLSIYGYDRNNPIDKLIQLPNIPVNEFGWKSYIVAK